MDHDHCLHQLQSLGASESSVLIVASFLRGRSMQISIDRVQGGSRPIVRGSPQGSVLGCLLYCVATQNLADPSELPTIETVTEAPPCTLPTQRSDIATPASPMFANERMRFFPSGSDSEGSEGICFWEAYTTPQSLDLSMSPASPPLPLRGNAERFKYIDDTTILEPVPMSGAVGHYTTEATREVLVPDALRTGLGEIARRAEGTGMKVNVKKTQLLCISPNNGCLTSAAFLPEGSDDWIQSTDTMKLVGFTFGSAPSVDAHVEAILCEFRRKIWMLYAGWYIDMSIQTGEGRRTLQYHGGFKNSGKHLQVEDNKQEKRKEKNGNHGASGH